MFLGKPLGQVKPSYIIFIAWIPSKGGQFFRRD